MFGEEVLPKLLAVKCAMRAKFHAEQCWRLVAHRQNGQKDRHTTQTNSHEQKHNPSPKAVPARIMRIFRGEEGRAGK